VLVGGGSAAGKTTLVEVILRDPSQKYFVVDCDEVKECLLSHQTSHAFVHREAFVLAEQIAHEAIRRGYSVLSDGTWCGEFELLKKRIAEYRPVGDGKLYAHYITADLDVVIAREKLRAHVTGRQVPREVLLRSHREVAEVVPKLFKTALIDMLWVWNNDGVGATPIACAKNLTVAVMNADKWSCFLEGAYAKSI
jgi:predicted ABC-type ATPase